MNIRLLPIKSFLHDGTFIDEETMKLIKDIEALGDYSFELSSVDDFYQGDLSLILVQSGGSEGYFLEMEPQLHAPYILLTYGTNNSLAASMEILSYLQGRHQDAEILHGSASYIASRIDALVSSKTVKKPPVNLGVVGQPSDWLIASNVEYNKVLERLNIRLVDVKIDELISLYHQVHVDDYENDTPIPFNEKEVQKAKKVSKALRVIQDKYHLQGLTLRCFDLLDSIETTGCLGLALLNRDKFMGTCEGDIPAMLSMYILNQVTNQPGFQANPSRIDTEKNEIVFAHCTLPLDMPTEYDVMTHYESGIGVAFRGKLKEGPITIFKLSNNLEDYYVAEGVITTNFEENNLCRTQINIKLDDVNYFLTSPYGNHHIIVYGHHKEALNEYMKSIG